MISQYSNDITNALSNLSKESTACRLASDIYHAVSSVIKYLEKGEALEAHIGSSFSHISYDIGKDDIQITHIFNDHVPQDVVEYAYEFVDRDLINSSLVYAKGVTYIGYILSTDHRVLNIKISIDKEKE